MNDTSLFGTPLQGHAYARARDDRIEWLLDMHPVTAEMLVSIGWFPTKGKALRRLARLVAKGRILFVGTVGRKSGRPEHVFCRWRPKIDALLHEVELTQLCLRFDASAIHRGPHATNPDIRPDAEMWINGQVFFVELDRGSMGYAQLAQRFQAYEGFAHFVLWVCSTVERTEKLRSQAELMRSAALFTTFAEACRDPHGEIWLDAHGGRAALPRERREAVEHVA